MEVIRQPQQVDPMSLEDRHQVLRQVSKYSKIKKELFEQSVDSTY